MTVEKIFFLIILWFGRNPEDCTYEGNLLACEKHEGCFMIIGLKVSNWKSFAEETVFSSMTTGKRYLNRVPQLSVRPSLHLSPIAVLYGGNASGKTNFISFLRYIQKLVCSPMPDEMDNAVIFRDGYKFHAPDVPRMALQKPS